MSELFSEIGLKAYIRGAWVDLFPDLKTSQPVRWSGIGIMSNSPLERVGNVSTLEFTLDNSEYNSHETRGYYTPGGSFSLDGWNPGVFVRLYFVYDGVYKGVFYGRINPDGITVKTGTNMSREVNVRAAGWMSEASKRSVEMLAYATYKRSDDALRLVVDNLPNAPLYQDFQAGREVFSTVFDVTRANTKATSEFNKIANSEFGFIYVRGDHRLSDYTGGQTLVFENRSWRYSQRDTPSYIPYHSSESITDVLLLEANDKVLLENGNGILLEASHFAIFRESDFMDLQVSYGRNLYNVARMNSYPRLVDTSPNILWNLEKPINIKAGSTINNLRCAYRDPNGKSTNISGINMIMPVSGSDYIANSENDGSGTDLTSYLTVDTQFGTSEAEFTLTNTGTTDLYIVTLRVRGYGVYTYDNASVVYESENSIQTYGANEITFDMPYISDATNLFMFSNNIDRLLLENGIDRILMENSDMVKADDSDGIFDLLVFDEPAYYIDSASLMANRDKFNMMAFMTLDAGSFIKLQETMTEVNTDYTYCINGYDGEIIDGVNVRWKPTLVSTLRFPRI